MSDIVRMKAVSYPRRKAIETKPVCLQVFSATGDVAADSQRDMKAPTLGAATCPAVQ
jgi:hypothetical protein